jgi:hypothetical protein
MTHRIKIKEHDFLHISNGKKKFMLKRIDNNYNVGDTVIMDEWTNISTGKKIEVLITYKIDSGEMSLIYPWFIFRFEIMRLKFE